MLLVARLLTTKTFLHLHFHFKTFSKKTKRFVYVLIETRTISKHLFKTLSETRFTNTSLNHFSKQNFVCVLIETRTITKRFFKILSKPTPQAHYQIKASEQVTKSPWKTLDEKGDNTFPFHNLPPELKK